MPFNWKTPFGYCVAMLDQAAAAFYTCLFSRLLFGQNHLKHLTVWTTFSFSIFNLFLRLSTHKSVIVSFFISSCWILSTIPKDIANDLTVLAEHKTPCGLRMKFYETITFYANAKQLSKMIDLNFKLNIFFETKTEFFRYVEQFVVCRFAIEFSDINEFIVTGVFLWTLSSMCCSLLVLQAEMVRTMHRIERCLTTQNNIIRTKYFSHFIPVTRFHRIDKPVVFRLLVIHFDLLLLWTRWTSHKRIWWIRQSAECMRLVFIPHRSATNATDGFHVYSAARYYSRLWKHIMRTNRF